MDDYNLYNLKQSSIFLLVPAGGDAGIPNQGLYDLLHSYTV